MNPRRTLAAAAAAALLAAAPAATAATTKQLDRRLRNAEARIRILEADIRDAAATLACFSATSAGISNATASVAYTFDPGSAALELGILNYFPPTLAFMTTSRSVIAPDGPSYLVLVDPSCVGATPRRAGTLRTGTLR